MKYLTYILLSTWPVLQLIIIYNLGKGGLVALDAHMSYVILLFCITLMVILLQKRHIRIGGPFIFWFIFFLYIIFNFYLKGSATSLGQLCRDQFRISILPLALFFIILNLDEYFSRKALVFSVIISGIIIAFIGISEFIAGSNLIGQTYNVGSNTLNIYRTNGPFHDAIGYSTIVLLYIPFTYYYLKEKIVSKSLFVCLFIFFTVGLVATLSRASMIAYMAIFLIMISGNDLKKFFIYLYLFILLATILYGAWGIISTSDIFVLRFKNEGSVVGRWNQYKECFSLFMDNPWLGIGYGAYKVTHEYFIHNSYLKNLVELGFFGFFFHVIFISSVLFSNFKKAFLSGSSSSLKVRLSFVIILIIVPNTIDLLNNYYFNLTLFTMIAVLSLSSGNKIETISAGSDVLDNGHRALITDNPSTGRNYVVL